jgi:hypothetical protein
VATTAAVTTNSIQIANSEWEETLEEGTVGYLNQLAVTQREETFS